GHGGAAGRRGGGGGGARALWLGGGGGVAGAHPVPARRRGRPGPATPGAGARQRAARTIPRTLLGWSRAAGGSTRRKRGFAEAGKCGRPNRTWRSRDVAVQPVETGWRASGKGG